MIEGNRIKFGYGDISVRASTSCQTIVFQQIARSRKCSSEDSGEWEYIGDPIGIQIDWQDYCHLLKMLKDVRERQYYIIHFKDYQLDFNNYYEDSIDVVERMATFAIGLQLMAVAC